MDRVFRSVCQGSHMECGALVHVKDGKIVKIEGDPEHPVSKGYNCVKGRVQHHFTYHPDRVLYPLRRVGERGSGKWERISWDTALDEIAAKITEVRDKYGPESFATIHGTGPRPSVVSSHLLATALGSPNVISVDTHICFLPNLVSSFLTLGDSIMMEVGPDYLNSDCIMVVGGNPLISHPPKGLEILRAKKERKAKLIVVDPYYSDLAARADLWLQIRPGTDVALALGMIKTILDEDLYDKDFVAKWCHGLEPLKERVKQYPLDKVAKLTWVPADKIREAARLYAMTKPAAMHARNGVDQNINSAQTCRALAILIGLTGNLDVKGGNLLHTHVPGLFGLADLRAGLEFRLPREVEEKRLGYKEFPLMSGSDSLFPVVIAPMAHQALRTGDPYPLKALFCVGGNPVVNMQSVKTFSQSLKDHLDLHVVADFFKTPTAEIADYILPCATWLEVDEICYLFYPNSIVARQKVIEPLGEAWPTLKISIELAKRIPWADRKYLPWDTVDEFNDAAVKGMGLTFNDLKEKGYVRTPVKYKKYDTQRLMTPTGKVELYSTLFEKHGYDPLPFYQEPPESPLSTPELMADYPLILFAGRKQMEFFHSAGHQVEELRKRLPDPLVEIHSETARQAGIEDGDWVWIETPQVKNERVRFKVRVTDNVHPKMAHAMHSWWYPEKPAPEHGCFESNINVVLTDQPPRGKVFGSVRLRGTLCRIYK